MRFNYKYTLITVLLCLFGNINGALCQWPCDTVVPSFNVDLSSNMDSLWISPAVVRDGNCCGTSHPDNCLEFVLTLHPNTISVNFQVESGAMPGGSLFYQIGCGPQTPVGTPICLDGPGPHYLTFCKPGNNQNTYSIQAYPEPIFGPDLTIASGCTDFLHAQYYDETTVTWTSVAPNNQGDYNGLLSCVAGCDTTYITSQAVNNPNTIDYYVCGYDISGCIDSAICDTIVANLLDLHTVEISATDTVLCSYETSSTLSVNSTGGTGDFTYLWSTGETGTSIVVGPGTYYVDVLDTSGCSSNSDTLTITQLPEVTVDAGTDLDVCNQFIQNISLSGVVQNATGVLWSGGQGSFTPDNAQLAPAYIPTASELLLSDMELYIESTGNQGCNSAKDTVKINLLPFMDTITITTTDIDCYHGTNGTATVTMDGSQSPWTFNLGNLSSNNTGIFTGLGAGDYLLEVLDNLGCGLDTSFNIMEPDSLIIQTTSQTNINCFGDATGSATVAASNGTPGYTYSWNTSPVQTGATATGLVAGTYTCTVTDDNGCVETIDITITQPTAALTITEVSTTDLNCFGDATGSATVAASNGTPGYTYSWNTSPVQTGATATGLVAGTYTCTVTDDNGCVETIDITITQPTAALTITEVSTTDVNCFGDATGSATVATSNGTPGYTYSWNTSPVQTGATATGLVAGTYTCTVTDDNGCVETKDITITQPTAALTVTQVSTTDVNCFGDATGLATVAASNGTPGYTYSWNTSPVQTGATAMGLVAGTYTCTVTDDNGCIETLDITITQPTAALTITEVSTTDVNCFGDATGSATVAASNGTPGYTYSWNTSPAQTGSTVTGLVAGTYTCTVTDDNGCIETIDITITQPTAALAVTEVSTTDVNCFGDATGSATVVANNGTPGYTYSWNTSPVQTGATATGLVAGTYTCIVTDDNGCIETIDITITQPTAALAVTEVSTTDVNCFGDATGSATVAASNGTPGYTYSWNTSPVQTGVTAMGLVAGTYTCTVTDDNGCIETIDITITQPTAALTITEVSTTDVNCFGDATGLATVAASNGTPGYTYSWNTSPVQTGATASNLTAGTYTCTVTDDNGCIETIDITITQPTAALTITEVSTTDLNCFGDATGSATVAASNGTPGYTYSWNTSPVQTGATASNLTAGTYTCTVTDDNGCVETIDIIITQPTAALTVTEVSSTDVNCFGDATGSATVAASNGTSGYTYSWNTSPVQTGATATGLVAGTYTCTVTDDNGCIETIDITITQPTAALTVTEVSTTDVNCFGDATGSATVAANNGTPGYTYSWNTSPVQTGATATGLVAGTYTCTVTDDNGCVETIDIIITQPAAALTVTEVSTTDVNCFGDATGSATVAANNGTPGYTYSWNTSPIQTGATATGLVAGTYTCTVTDDNGCIETIDITITQPTAALAVTEVSTTDVNCFGDATGSATVAASNGTPGYTYSWNTSPVQTGATATGLVAGTYTCTVTDDNGCVETIDITITQPTAALTITEVSTTDVNCFGDATGSATVAASNGTPGYTYSWNTSPVQTGATATGLVAGTYTCTVTDDNGCIETIDITITQPTAALTITEVSTADVNCFGDATGSATVSASNGTPGYTYSWNTSPVQTSATATNLSAGTYACTVTDALGCIETIDITITEPSAQLNISLISKVNVDCFGSSNGSATVSANGGTPAYTYVWSTSPIQNGPTATGLLAGNYTCLVTDALGCSETISINISQPNAALDLQISNTTDVNCFGEQSGSISVIGSGGAPGYSYSWSHNANLNSPNANNLAFGNYACTIEDMNGCTSTVQTTIYQPQAPISLNITSIYNVNCFGGSDGSVTIDAVGGTPGYTYTWNTLPIQTGPTATNLSVGNYTCTVTDANGCVEFISININQPQFPLSLSVNSIQNVDCYNSATGSATINAQGGTAGYSYSWNTNPAQNSATATNLSAGNYTCLVTDDNGCQDSITIQINEPANALSANIFSKTDVNCFGGNNGSAIANASGGTPGYNYSWNTFPVQNGNVASGLTAGTYTCTVTDANGCTTNVDVNITEPNQALSLITINTQNISCYNGSDGSISINAAGGTPGYTYFWNTFPIQNGSTASNLSAGSYTCTVTDNNGCQSTLTVSLTQPTNPLSVSINDYTDVDCHGASTGEAIAEALGGTQGYTYVWNSSPVQYNDTASNLPAGTYTCEVYDAQGCFASSTVEIHEPLTPISLTNTSLTDVLCNSDNTGAASINASGGTPGYNYLWNTTPVQFSDSVTDLSSGTYTCLVTDANACVDSISISISEPSQALSTTIISQQNINCFGDSTGAIEVVGTGGTPNYIYNWNNTPNQTSNILNGVSAGNHFVIVTDENGCSDSLNINLSQPQSPLNLNITQVTPILCNNDSNGAIEVNATGGTPLYNYTWTNSPLLTGNSISGLDAQNYEAVVTDDLGCTDTVQIPLDNPALLEATINADTALCLGASIDITVNPTGGTGNYQYSWNPNLSITNVLSDIPTSDQIYTCTIVDDNNCSVTVSTNVIVHFTDPNDITAITDQIEICEFDSVQLSYIFAGSTIDMDIEWLHCPTCDPNQPLFAQVVSDTMFIISATNQCNQTVYDTVFINVNEIPVVDIYPNSTTICEFNTVDFTNYGDNNPNWTYSWDFGDGNSSNQMNPSNYYAYNAVYPVTLMITDENGCTSLDTAAATVTVNPQAIASFNVSPGTSSTMDDPVFDFQNTSIHADDFLWTFGDGAYDFSTHPTHMYDFHGQYTVILSANNEFNCPDTVAQNIDIKATHGIYLPNTFTPDDDDYNNTFFPEAYGLSKEGYQMIIFNRWGEVIFESNQIEIGWDGYYKQTPVKDGVYTWVVYYKTLDNESFKIVGHVTVLR